VTALYLAGFIGLLGAAVVGRFALLEFRRDRIPVLNYHRVVSDRDISRCTKHAYVVSETEFEKQMCHLRDRGFTAIDLDDYLYYREHRSELPPKPIIITLDDGYENNYLYAYPALKKCGFKAVIYSISDPDAPFLNSFEFPERLLSPAQMKELSDNGISIQGHTHSHVRLKFETDDAIERELATNKKTLEAVTGRPVRHMAIPYGLYDKRLFEIARRTGYCTIEVPGKGTINLDTDLFHLRRLSIHNLTTLPQLDKMVSSPLNTLIQRLYAFGQLAVRNTMGSGVEKRLKLLFSRIGLDNPERLFKFAVGLGAATAALYLLLRFAG
jgi:peptidoglycan/xylan/chitin deacetylase (PgdA/CDA1 family)